MSNHLQSALKQSKEAWIVGEGLEELYHTNAIVHAWLKYYVFGLVTQTQALVGIAKDLAVSNEILRNQLLEKMQCYTPTGVQAMSPKLCPRCSGLGRVVEKEGSTNVVICPECSKP